MKHHTLNDDKVVLALIHNDTIKGLKAFGNGTGKFDIDHEVTPGPLRNDHQAVALPWTYVGNHTARIFGVPPSGAEVIVHGITIIHKHAGKVAMRRYIDWDHVKAQLGLIAG
jgi:SnoaL-like polyketide cyclase